MEEAETVRSQKRDAILLDDFLEFRLAPGAVASGFLEARRDDDGCLDALLAALAQNIRDGNSRNDDDGEVDIFRDGSDVRITRQIEKRRSIRIDRIDFYAATDR